MPLADESTRSSRDAALRLDEIVARFEQAHKSGGEPQIEAFLDVDETLRPALLVELVQTDLELRFKAGKPVQVEHYVERFPELASDRRQVLDLIAAEYRWRKRLAPETEMEPYLRRFPIYAQELQDHLAACDQATHASAPGDPAHSTRGLGDGACAEIASPESELELPKIAGYQILGELGHGGMGVVYRAYDQQRKKVVALKMVRSLNPKSLYLFKQEFRTLADLAHPNLVTLHELVSDGRMWFFTMELVGGTDFLSYLRPRGVSLAGALLPAEQLPHLRTVLRQLAEGMMTLHNAGKLHRDIKPSNVMVEHGGRAVLLDFGLAAELDEAGAHHSTVPHILGTVAYMAPEQAASKPVSAASDWYSVGVMLFQVLTGRLPFEGPPLEILRQKQEADPKFPQLPDAYSDVLLLCQELMCREPQTRPTGQDVLRRISIRKTEATASPLVPPTAASRSVFVGRKSHLAALQAAFDEVRQGKPAAVLVRGNSGTGKSALVQHFLDELASQHEVVVLNGRCYERELVPYKALDGLIDALSRYLVRLPEFEVRVFLPREITPLSRMFPVLRRVEAIAAAQRDVEIPDAQELRRRAFAALRELLGRIGDARPLVLSIDDLQWGDADSAALLKEILRPPDSPVLLVIGCHRSEDAKTSAFLQAFVNEHGQAESWLNVRAIPVEPLTVEEATELALTQLDATNPQSKSLADHVARESKGSPFFVYELLQSLAGATPAQDNRRASDKLVIDNVLWERIERLPADARQLLEVVSVAGKPLWAEAAFQAAGLPAVDEAALGMLGAGRLIRCATVEPKKLIESYHDRVRETVVAHLSPEVLASHHLNLAEVLERVEGTDPETLAVHWQAAGRRERAGHYYSLAAARASEALAFDRAAKLYRLALDSSAFGEQQQHELQVLLADSLANGGRGKAAAETYRIAASETSGAEALELQRQAAMQLLITGHMDEGLAAIRTVLAAKGMTLPRSARGALASMLWQRFKLWLRGLKFRECDETEVDPDLLARLDICWAVVSGLTLVDITKGLDYQSRYLLGALRLGERRHVARALAFEVAYRAAGGNSSREAIKSFLDRADELVRKLESAELNGFVKMAAGVAWYGVGRWNLALMSCDEAEVILRSRCAGVAWELNTAQSFGTYALYMMGNVRELSRRLPRLCAEAEAVGNLYAFASYKSYGHHLVELANDRACEVQKEFRRTMTHWSERFPVQYNSAAAGFVYSCFYNNEFKAAWSFLHSEFLPYLARTLTMRIQVFRIISRFIQGRAALALAKEPDDSFVAAAGRAARRLHRENSPWAAALATIIEAGVAHLKRTPSRAIALLQRSALELDQVDMRLLAASVRIQLGRALGGDQGRELLNRGESWMSGQEVKDPHRLAAVFVPDLCDL